MALWADEFAQCTVLLLSTCQKTIQRLPIGGIDLRLQEVLQTGGRELLRPVDEESDALLPDKGGGAESVGNDGAAVVESIQNAAAAAFLVAFPIVDDDIFGFAESLFVFIIAHVAFGERDIGSVAAELTQFLHCGAIIGAGFEGESGDSKMKGGANKAASHIGDALAVGQNAVDAEIDSLGTGGGGTCKIEVVGNDDVGASPCLSDVRQGADDSVQMPPCPAVEEAMEGR